jgi:hypothetical protein
MISFQQGLHIHKAFCLLAIDQNLIAPHLDRKCKHKGSVFTPQDATAALTPRAQALTNIH